MRLSVFLYVLSGLAASLAAQQSAPGSQEVAIQIVTGDGAINSIRLRRGHDPSVRVVNSSGEPIAGAMVTFLLPASGPSGEFAGSGLSITVPTDARGVAVGRGMRPNGLPGQFRIRVTTTVRGSPASATIAQTNAEPVVKSGHTKLYIILGAVAGAAIGGVALAAGGGSTASGGTTGGTTSSGAIISGAPTIGPPR